MKNAQNSNCIVCEDQIDTLSLICKEEHCITFYNAIISPLEDVVAKLEKCNINYDDYYHTFVSLSLPAQTWLLVHYDLLNEVFWESINLMDSSDLLISLTSNDDFRFKFYLMLTPKIREEIKNEIETWVTQKVIESNQINTIGEKLENFLLLILEYSTSITNNKYKMKNT
ncbi:MAG: hypothetical protein ACW967_04485 [Candidatus Hodarchaeales archaeon]|jgi:hypothetical protein